VNSRWLSFGWAFGIIKATPSFVYVCITMQTLLASLLHVPKLIVAPLCLNKIICLVNAFGINPFDLYRFSNAHAKKAPTYEIE
jgi:hypothetical protein